MEFEQRYAEGLRVDVEAQWGAGFLADRYRPGELSWDWTGVARPLLDAAERALDMGTGDGGVLDGLAPLPAVTVAYESWPPTIPAAVATLRPLGVHLVQATGSPDNVATPPADPARQDPFASLPFADGVFDLVLNRHEAFDPTDLLRVTRPGGIFLTQQVGSDEAGSVRSLFDLPDDQPRWESPVAVAQLERAGWRVEEVREERVLGTFADIAALIAYVRSLPWAYADLSLDAARPRLRQLHEQASVRAVPTVTHRFLVRARRPL